VKPIKFAFLALCALGALAFATPAYAAGATTQTIHLNGVPTDVGPSGCLNGDVVITGNIVEHFTVNSTGDWFTATAEGAATVADSGTGATLWSGHATAWFGFEGNNNNLVQHAILDGHGTLADGTSLRIHQEFQFTMNAQGVITVFNMRTTCS
jgi:hypothetical protein